MRAMPVAPTVVILLHSSTLPPSLLPFHPSHPPNQGEALVQDCQACCEEDEDDLEVAAGKVREY